MLQTLIAFVGRSVTSSAPRQIPYCLTFTRGRKLWIRPYLVDLYKRRLDQGPEPERPRSVWINWNYDAEIYAFGKRLGEEFKTKTLKQAFVMNSFIDKEKAERSRLLGSAGDVEIDDNQQLARLGETNSRLFIDSYLRQYLPKLPLDGVRAVTNYLMSEDVLLHISSNLGVKDLVLSAEFPVPAQSLITVLKAVIGALYTDQGKSRGDKFVQDFIVTQLIGKDIFEMWTVNNPMGLLLDTLRQQGRSDPESRLLWSTGSETILASYVVGIYVDRQLIGQAPGETTTIGEEMAARDALRRMWSVGPSQSPLFCQEHKFGLSGRLTDSDASTDKSSSSIAA